MKEYAETTRAVVRPIVTISFSASWIGVTMYLIVANLGLSAPYILLTTVTWGVIVWYYDDRTFFHRHTSPLSVLASWVKKDRGKL